MCVAKTKKWSRKVLYIKHEKFRHYYYPYACVGVCACPRWCYVFHAGFHSCFDKCFMKNEFFRAQTHYTCQSNATPFLPSPNSMSDSLSLSFFCLSVREWEWNEHVLHKQHNIFICAFKLYFSYILSLIYVLWLLLIACFYTVSFHVYVWFFFQFKTLLVWFLAASIEVYCSALDTFYNRKSLYDAIHFVLATFSYVGFYIDIRT